MNFPQGRKPGLLLGLEWEEEREWEEWEGAWKRGGNGNYYKVINFYNTLLTVLVFFYKKKRKNKNKTKQKKIP